MKYLFINSVYGLRSTGKLVAQQCHELQAQGHTCLAAYGRQTAPDTAVKQLPIGGGMDQKLHWLMTRCFDRQGFSSRRATRQFLKAVDEYGPDVIWLHNLHGYYIQVELLFSYLRQHPEIQVYWTLHDCWAFTGHCAYFTYARCEKWKTGCECCKNGKAYPRTLGPARGQRNYRRKKAAFTGLPNLTLITPSRWLAKLTRESFLREYPVQVVPNTVDPGVFYPGESVIRQRNAMGDHYVILGVAVGWENTKGFPDMLELRARLPKQYQMVLVGVTKQQKRRLPSGIIGITATKNQQELAQLYRAADVFVNPTHQDNYPTVNLEAAACGTPVVTYDVGGSPESVPAENVVPEGDISALVRRITAICESRRTERCQR